MSKKYSSDNKVKFNQNVSAAKIQAALQQGAALHKQGRLNEARQLYESILDVQPDNFDALNLLATVNAQTRCYQTAVDLFNKAIAVNPNIAAAHHNLGNTLKQLNRLDEALSSYDRALAIRSDYTEVYIKKGDLLVILGRLDEALASYDRALELKPDYGVALNNRGVVLKNLKRLDEALASYNRLLAINPNIAEVHNNRGNVLQDLKRFDEALLSYERAMALNPDSSETYNNLGNVLDELGHTDEALVNYNRAVELQPDFAEAYYSRGNLLAGLKDLDEALISYEKALTFNPDLAFLRGSELHTRMKLCQWDRLGERIDDIKDRLDCSDNVMLPFHMLVLLDAPNLHKRLTMAYAASEYPAMIGLGDIPRRPNDGRIRIGYYSADFYNHATSYLMVELFEKHDSDRFEIYGFSFGVSAGDEMHQRVAAAFDQFIDVSNMSDVAIAQLSRRHGIDIAIDLKGYTQYSRPGMFAARCAPIQVNYLGYPGTMGAEYIDYIIADKIVIPEGSQDDYTEKVVYLPHSYQVNDSKRKISGRVFTRQEAGLPEEGFVFCCFNNSYKILPATFDIWMRLLQEVDGSVLWLLEDNPMATRNLRREAVSRGVAEERLIFSERLPLAEHLARHRLADLFIDTLPCNAHTTASDALWAGLPVLTCVGESFASRVAASLLNAVGLPELVTCSFQEYETRALELAMDREQLARIKKSLEHNRMTAPLFNTELFVRHIESAYEAMYTRYQADLPPESIIIE